MKFWNTLFIGITATGTLLNIMRFIHQPNLLIFFSICVCAFALIVTLDERRGM